MSTGAAVVAANGVAEGVALAELSAGIPVSPLYGAGVLQSPSELIECEEQSRLLDRGYSLVTEWQGEMRRIAMSTKRSNDE